MEKTPLIEHLRVSPDGYVISAGDVLEVADLIRAGAVAVRQEGDDIVAWLVEAEAKK